MIRNVTNHWVKRAFRERHSIRGRVDGGRATLLSLAWVLSAVLVGSFEVAIDPLMAWERLLGILFALLIPILGIASALDLVEQFACPSNRVALAARHGANRQAKLLFALAGALGRGLLLTTLALVVGRHFCHPATAPLFQHDLVVCCGIGYLATSAYIAYFFAATRLGIGRAGAWVAFGLDLTLGHVGAGVSMLTPYRFAQNLIGHPAVFSVSAIASSWILLGFVVVGLSFAIIKTPG